MWAGVLSQCLLLPSAEVRCETSVPADVNPPQGKVWLCASVCVRMCVHMYVCLSVCMCCYALGVILHDVLSNSSWFLCRGDLRDGHEGMTLLLTPMDRVVMKHAPGGGQPEGKLVERRELLQLGSPLEKAELELLSDVCKVVFNMTMSWRANEEDYHDDERTLWNCFVHLSRVLFNSLHCEDDPDTQNVLQ